MSPEPPDRCGVERTNETLACAVSVFYQFRFLSVYTGKHMDSVYAENTLVCVTLVLLGYEALWALTF